MEKQEKKLNSSLRLLFKTSLFIFVAILLSKIFSYVYRIIIARHFGAEVYGLFSLAIIIIGWFGAIASLGLIEGILRYISLYRGKNEIKKIKYAFRISSKILIISTLITAAISFLLADFISISIFHNPNLIIYLKIFSFMIPFWVFGVYFISIMMSFEKIKQQSFLDGIVHNAIKVLSIVFLIFIGFKTNAVIFSFFLGVFFLFLLSYLYCKYKLSEIFKHAYLKQKTKNKIFKSLISYSWPLMFFGILIGIFYWTDSFIIGYFKSATEVGFYNVAVPIALFLTLAPDLFIQLFFPIITKEYARKNFQLIKELSKQIGKWIFMINIPLFLLVISFPGAIIKIMFGAEYLVAATALRLLLIGSLFSSMFIISNRLISMIGKSKLILIDLVIASIINIILNIWLVPMNSILGINNSLGINGAAIATVISIIIFNSLLMIQARHYTSIIPLRRKMLRIFLISLIPFLVLLFLKKLVVINILSIIILSAIFFLLYFILLILFKGFDRNDLVIISSIKKKLKSIVTN